MVEEVLAQRDLAAAESHELGVRPTEVFAKALLQELLEAYREYPSEKAVQLVLSPDTAEVSFTTDRLLLSRILANLLKNAIEASTNGEPVTAGCRNVDGQPEFWVHNAGFIPAETQQQIFQRSFSTKGPGRGLGTYSVKLLCDRYLNGQAAFITSPEQGTTFTVRFPARLDAPRSAH
jgi:signal transduction histidine kinase